MKRLTAGCMSLKYTDFGTVESVIVNGDELISDALSGFFITDMETGKESVFSAELFDNEKGYVQSGELSEHAIHMNAEYTVFHNAVRMDALLETTDVTDRKIRVEYRLPLRNNGLCWYSDISNKAPIDAAGTYVNLTDSTLDGHEVSVYPFAAVSDGSHTVAMAVPMDPPLISRIAYSQSDKSSDGYMSVRFDLLLSASVSKLTSKAEFSILIYAPTVQNWGIRAAAKDYYNMFPEDFLKKRPGGNWLFQHAYDRLENVEDFAFGYNETPGSFAFDKQNNVASFRYTAPAEQWMEWPGQKKEPEPTYEQYMERFAELLNDTSENMEPGFPDVRVKDAAEAIRNSANLLADGRYFTVGWYVYGETVCFVTNHTPDIPGFNSFNLQISNIERFERKAAEEGTKLDGVYIDNLAGLGSYNYRKDHFYYSDLPLTWDAEMRTVLPMYSSNYSYTKAIRKRCDERGQLILANMVFPERGTAEYIHMVDVPGSEIGPHWGWGPKIQRLRRTLTYRKPWMLLLGHDLDSISVSASSCPYDIKENIMRSAVAYGLFANVIGYRVPLEDYESSRPLFKKYTPVVRVEDKLGWEPITNAYAEVSGEADLERYGDLALGASIFTLYNVGNVECSGKITLALDEMGVSAEKAELLEAYELIGDAPVPTPRKIDLQSSGNTVSYPCRLNPNEVSAVIIGEREQVKKELSEFGICFFC